jgi:hypothetical protein
VDAQPFQHEWTNCCEMNQIARQVSLSWHPINPQAGFHDPFWQSQKTLIGGVAVIRICGADTILLNEFSLLCGLVKSCWRSIRRPTQGDMDRNEAFVF